MDKINHATLASSTVQSRLLPLRSCCASRTARNLQKSGHWVSCSTRSSLEKYHSRIQAWLSPVVSPRPRSRSLPSACTCYLACSSATQISDQLSRWSELTRGSRPTCNYLISSAYPSYSPYPLRQPVSSRASQPPNSTVHRIPSALNYTYILTSTRTNIYTYINFMVASSRFYSLHHVFNAPFSFPILLALFFLSLKLCMLFISPNTKRKHPSPLDQKSTLQLIYTYLHSLIPLHAFTTVLRKRVLMITIFIPSPF